MGEEGDTLMDRQERHDKGEGKEGQRKRTLNGSKHRLGTPETLRVLIPQMGHLMKQDQFRGLISLFKPFPQPG